MTAPESPFDAPLHGRLLIEASAGTGKTYALTSLIARLLVETEHTIDRLVVVTFTIAATAELRDRIRRTLRDTLHRLAGRNDRPPEDDQAAELIAHWECAGIEEEDASRRLTAALRDFDRANVSTIHGFCQRMLTEFAFDGDVPFGFEVGGDARPQVTAAIQDVWRRHVVNAPAELVRHVQASKLDVDKLASWATGLHAQSDLQVRGGDAMPADLEDELRAAREDETSAFAAAWECWKKEGKAFREALASPPWKGNSLGKIERLWNIVEAAFEATDFALMTEEAMDYLRTDSLRGTTPRNAKLLKGEPLPAPTLIEHLDRLAEVAAASAEARDEWLRGLRRQTLDEVRDALHRGVWQDRQLSFDALLVEMKRALNTRGDVLVRRIRDRYPFALIDEFQDTDPIQAEIFERIYGAEAEGVETAAAEESPTPRKGLVVVGDPKQSIYGFRGADIFAYLHAKDRTPKDRQLKLPKNFRSTPALVCAVNALFGRDAPFRLPEIEHDEVEAAKDEGVGLRIEGENAGAPMRLRLCGGAGGKPWPKMAFRDVAAARAAADIVELLSLAADGKATIAEGGEPNAECRPLIGSDIAVLVRTRNQGSKVADALRRRGVESVEIGDESVFATAEAEQLHRLLAALADAPGASREADCLRGALSADLFDLDLADLAALKDDDDEWARWLQCAEDWRDIWERSGVATLIRNLLFAEDVHGADALLRYSDGPRQLTNTMHLAELLQQAEAGERLSPPGLVEWLARSRADAGSGEEALLRLQSDDKLVRVLTVHKSKGLEFPVVFCPFAWDGRRPASDATVLYHDEAGEAVLDLHPDEDVRDRAREEEASEELRLLYVALTRAQYRCVVTWAFAKELEHAPLTWLLHDGLAPSSEDRLREVVQALADEHPDAIEAIPFDADAMPSLRLAGSSGAGRSDASPLAARAFDRTLGRRRQMSSYSALVAEAGAAESADEHREVERPDHDQRADSDEPPNTPPKADERFAGRTPFTFPRGRHAGNCLHEIFQGLADPASAKRTVDECLTRARIGGEWADVAREIVDTARNTPLPCGENAAHLVLSKLDNPVAEMEFHLPAAGLDRRKLGECLAEHGYDDPFASLADERINGFLHGYIDLVARHDDRFYVVDYKSNWLGGTRAHYSKDNIDAAMRQHDYPLQYLLYLTALHRHLRQRLPDYDYDQHMGGAFYLFVRGMSPDCPGHSIYSDCPPRACIEAIDTCLRGDDAEGN